MNFTELKVAEVAKRELLLLHGAHQSKTISAEQATRLVDERAVERIRVYVNLLETEYEKLRDESNILSDKLSAQSLLVKDYTTYVEKLKHDRDALQADVDVLEERFGKESRARETLTKALRDQIEDLQERNIAATTQLVEVQKEYATQIDLVDQLTEERDAALQSRRMKKRDVDVRKKRGKERGEGQGERKVEWGRGRERERYIYSTVGCRRTVCRRTARLEFHLKIRTTPGWKNELRAVSPHANSFCCEDDCFYVIADFETTPLRRFEIFQPHSPPGMRRRVPCARYKLTYVTRSRIEK